MKLNVKVHNGIHYENLSPSEHLISLNATLLHPVGQSPNVRTTLDFPLQIYSATSPTDQTYCLSGITSAVQYSWHRFDSCFHVKPTYLRHIPTNDPPHCTSTSFQMAYIHLKSYLSYIKYLTDPNLFEITSEPLGIAYSMFLIIYSLHTSHLSSHHPIPNTAHIYHII